YLGQDITGYISATSASSGLGAHGGHGRRSLTTSTKLPQYSSIAFLNMASGNTTNDDTVGWQTGPRDRGTVTLIWGCVTTIFACSWTILHLNVPALTDSAWTRFLRKAKWMAITIVFPEFILSEAICDLRLALRELREFDEDLRSNENDVKWKTSFWPNATIWAYEWSWRVEYPRYARLIYRLLVLKPPVQNLDEILSSSNEAESEAMELTTFYDNEEEQEQGEEEQQEQVEEEVSSPRYSATSSGQELEAQGSSHGSIDRVRDPTPSNKSARSGREINSTRSFKTSQLVQETQAWTVVHSYFAQMGGLAYMDKRSTKYRGKGPKYLALQASKLSTRYTWFNTHPLQHLVLRKDDIEDKSKADSFVKSIAVFQIAWLVLNVIARAIKKLPITQLEIATIAFALMAILTYATNWWKPKDVSRPIHLLHSCSGSSRDPNGKELMQSFMIRLRRPHKAEENSREISDIERVPNDWVWMEGQTPLFYHLLGATSLVFGSLHCIAWNFEFPTRIELLCWRSASLLSATLPALALGLSVGMSYLRIDYFGRKHTAILLHLLEPFESISDEKWKHLFEPRFSQWNRDAIEALMAMPKDSDTNWEVEPSQDIIEELRGEEWDMDRSDPCLQFIKGLKLFHSSWQASQLEGSRHILSGEVLCREIKDMAWCIHLCSREYDFQNFWRQYEGFVDKKLGTPTGDWSETSCVDTIMKAHEETNAKVEKLKSRLDLAMRMVEALNLVG
ncbi:hypothetical protein LB507_006154, partial [Fusarium sp. FIESC RH6]